MEDGGDKRGDAKGDWKGASIVTALLVSRRARG